MLILMMVPVTHGKAAEKLTLGQVRPMAEVNGNEIPAANSFSIDSMDISPNNDGRLDYTNINLSFNTFQPFVYVGLWDYINPKAGPNRDGFLGFVAFDYDLAAGNYVVEWDGTYISAADDFKVVKAAPDGVYKLIAWGENADQTDFVMQPQEIWPVFIKTSIPKIGAENTTIDGSKGVFRGSVNDAYVDWSYKISPINYNYKYYPSSKFALTYDLTNPKGEKLVSKAPLSIDDWGGFEIPLEGLTLGDYKIKIYVDDAAGNHVEQEYTITVVDRTAPQVNVQFSSESGNIYVDDEITVTLNVTDNLSGVKTVEYKINDGKWTPYTGPFKFTKIKGATNLIHYHTVDNVGNELSNYTPLWADTDAPMTGIDFEGVESSTWIYGDWWYKSDVKVTLKPTDSQSGVKLTEYKIDDGEWMTYTSPFTITKEGYTIIYYKSTDYVGNTESRRLYEVQIDKTAPIVTGVENGKTYNSDVTITFDEGKGELNGNPFTSGSVVSTPGNYTLVVKDKASNVTSVSFKIEKTSPPVVDPPVDPTPPPVITPPVVSPPPTGTAQTDTTPPKVSGVENYGFYNKDVTISFSDGKATLNGKEIANNSVVKAEGTYELVVRDEAGNKTTIEFTIDKTAPKVSGISHNAVYNKNVTVTFNEGTARLNGSWFENNTIVNKDGIYTLVVTDEAGNKTTVKFMVDKKAPTVSGAANNAYYNKDVTIKFDEGMATLNGKKLGNSSVVKAEGTYVLIVTDAAGNRTTIKFTIDKTAPIVPTVNSLTTKTSVISGKAEKGTTVYIYNGKKLLGKAVVNAKGEYSIKTGIQKKGVTLTIFARDLAGNQSKSIVMKVK